MLYAWIIAVLGIWTGVVPIFSASPAFYSWSYWIVGIIAAVLGFAMVARRPLQGWITGIAGIWLFIAGFVGGLAMGAGLWWNSVLLGLVLLITGIWGAGEAPQAHHGHTEGHSPA